MSKVRFNNFGLDSYQFKTPSARFVDRIKVLFSGFYKLVAALAALAGASALLAVFLLARLALFTAFFWVCWNNGIVDAFDMPQITFVTALACSVLFMVAPYFMGITKATDK